MKVLGLDLGSASIGWALVELNDIATQSQLLGWGVRVVPYTSDAIASDFKAGRGETACSERTAKRGMRRNLDRWQLHREQLQDLLVKNGIWNKAESFPSLNPIEMWQLRANAAVNDHKLSLQQLSQVLLHINHRRGYRHAKSDMGGGKETEYVTRINDLHKTLIELGQTPGQYFCNRLNESESISANGKKHYSYRIKEQVLPRRAYEDETMQILKAQQTHHPEILTDAVIKDIHRVIFYQRPLKSCKHLVARCEFECRRIVNHEGKEILVGPKVAPRTSPIAQVCRIYEAINNIVLVNPRIDKNANNINLAELTESNPAYFQIRKHQHQFEINDDERQRIFEHLNSHDKLTLTDLFKILGLKRADGFKGDKLLTKGIKGNDTLMSIKKAISSLPEKKQTELLKFDLKLDTRCNQETGEVTELISSDYQNEPLYMLWHTLYSIDNRDELKSVLRAKFGIEDENVLENLFAIDFVKAGYSNKSALFMRRILPNLMNGYKYSDACAAVGVNHSNSITTEQNEARILLERIPQIACGTLRQPIVEKILNQAINVVNAVKDRFGDIDEVRVELARELKQSREDRSETESAMRKLEKENEKHRSTIQEMGITPTQRRVRKLRLLDETGYKCMYCNTPVGPTQFIEGHGYEIEHIIPRSRLFDDSYANTVCACRKCNAEKGNMTAYEYMSGKSETEFNSFKERVIDLHHTNKISKRKRDYLLMDGGDIPQDFINRNLNETQYITKKMLEILRAGIRNVYASSGSVTDFFRHAWGYDNLLHDVNFARYANVGLIEDVEYESHNQFHKVSRIKDWNKRRDHRHHAVDALVVALTRQSYIQRLNTLNTIHDNDIRCGEKRNLQRWASERSHIDIETLRAEADKISISFKGGKKLTTPGKRYITKQGQERRTLVPRAPLHKETVYGQILVHDGKKSVKYALEHPDLIQNAQLRAIITNLLAQHQNDVKAVLKSLKKNQLVHNDKNIDTIHCFRKEIVVKYDIKAIKRKDINWIVDKHIRELVRARYSTVASDKEFEVSINDMPLYSDAACTQKINTVRCFTGLNRENLAVVSRNNRQKAIGFSETRNNHHMAIYRKADGSLKVLVCSFWECVKRKQNGIPAIIENPVQALDILANLPSNDDTELIARGMPSHDDEFLLSLQRNEMVVLGMSDEDWNDAVSSKDYALINQHLYRVWKMGDSDYNFKIHTNTEAAIKDGDKETNAYYRCGSLKALFALNPRKISVDILGQLQL